MILPEAPEGAQASGVERKGASYVRRAGRRQGAEERADRPAAGGLDTRGENKYRELPDEVSAYDSSSASERARYASSRKGLEEDDNTSSGERERYGLERKGRKGAGGLGVEKPWLYAETSFAGQGRIKVHVNDRVGWKTWVWAKPYMTVGQLKVLIGTKLGKNPQNIRLQR